MRNIVLFLLVALVANVCLTEQAFATGGGKAGGKKKNRICVQNANSVGGRAITVWVLPTDTKLPATVGDARKLKPQKNVQAFKTECFNVKPGEYVIVAADTQVYKSAPADTPISKEVVAIEGPVEVDGSALSFGVFTDGDEPTYTPGIYDND